MSYIRSLSNPEGLYIFGSNGIHIYHGLKPPLCSEKSWPIVIPESDFYRVCHAWDHGPDQWKGPAYSRDFSAREELIFVNTGKRVPDDVASMRRSMKDLFKGKKRPLERFVIRLQYKKKYIMIWRVTWHYVVENVVKRSHENFRCKWCMKRGK